MIAWYTSAWFDKYVKHDSSADNRLLTERWRNDSIEQGVDPNHDPNMISFYYYSRLDFHRSNGQVFDCEDLRDGCPGMVTNDGYPGTYSYVNIDTSPDSLHGPGSNLRGGCTTRHVRIRFYRAHGRKRITKVKVFVNGKLVMTKRGHALRRITLPVISGKRRHRVRIVEYSGKHVVRRVRLRMRGCAL